VFKCVPFLVKGLRYVEKDSSCILFLFQATYNYFGDSLDFVTCTLLCFVGRPLGLFASVRHEPMTDGIVVLVY